MNEWKFEITDAVNRRFRVSKGTHEWLEGQSNNGSTTPRPVAGSVLEDGNGGLRVLVIFDDGKTGEYGRSTTAGQLNFVRWI